MTKMNTKIALAAALLAAGFATSAFASDASEVLHQDVNGPVVQQQTLRGADAAYAYAPASQSRVNVAEQREFDRATAAALSQ